eukprot:CAMPEP_0197022084 /NCGR_PEP_ID=MMETSP1384-20130603/2996_1 /TAXON_ID=29189 /ORGANISM="Ammonia sp." /LENGTH=173 /DNA_ID=CAMNT_0042450053 /DNA_START=25 /DNA_END=546 /DNA_ORIENTATION=+
MGQGSSTVTSSTINKYPDIQRKLRLNGRNNLRCQFVTVDKHPELIIFENSPEYDDDPVVVIDLVYRGEKDRHFRQNVVRVQGNTYGRFTNDARFSIGDKIQDIRKPMEDIVDWCIEYQEKNLEYSWSKKNCRTFMIALCKFISITWPDQQLFEELWYKSAGFTDSLTNSYEHL